jgi:hypothetical protein
MSISKKRKEERCNVTRPADFLRAEPVGASPRR